MKLHDPDRLRRLVRKKGPFPVTGPVPQLPDVDALPNYEQQDVALLHPYVPEEQHMEDRLREEFRKSVRTLFVNMSEEQVDAYVEEGFKLDAGALRAATFLEKSRAQPDRPLPYSERPPGMKFEQFMRHEYLAKGILTQEGFTLNSLRKIDPDLAQAYSGQSLRKDIPPDIRIRKERDRPNRRERSAQAPQITKF